jgi:hypothetical protein
MCGKRCYFDLTSHRLKRWFGAVFKTAYIAGKGAPLEQTRTIVDYQLDAMTTLMRRVDDKLLLLPRPALTKSPVGYWLSQDLSLVFGRKLPAWRSMIPLHGDMRCGYGDGFRRASHQRWKRTGWIVTA